TSKKPIDGGLSVNHHHPSESPACTRSVTVHWNSTEEPLTVAPPPPEHSQAPVPLPRSKQRKQPPAEENQGQILVQLGEDCDTLRSDPGETASNKYLNELLEVFSLSNEREENSHSADGVREGEDAGGDMSHNHRNIRDRIQAFESSAEASEPAKPDPEPRKVTTRPPVATKPSVAIRPLFNHSVDDDSQNVSHVNNPPAPAPKPQPPKKPVGLAIKGELETLHSKGSISNRSHPPKLTRSSCVFDEDPLPVPPLKLAKEPLKPNLNINNHNSTTVLQNQNEDSPSNNVPVNRSSFAKQSGTRRPTTIRIPNMSQDNPPPLPARKPVGELVLPPRRLNKTKSLPPRPPPAKSGPGGPPPPSIQSTGRSKSASWDTPAKNQSHRKGPVLPPRPNPGHRLYNKYTLQLPHGIAAINYGGSQSEELSFQKNEVLVLIEEIDLDTYECQIGDERGRVHKSHMKIITPLNSVGDSPPPQYTDCGLTVQAVYDFSPEGPGELSLRAGDVVTMVEQVDTEWYTGTCRGTTGFFPITYVKILSNSPRTLPARKTKPPAATVSGPRCVARFDFEGEHGDELTFSEGDVIQLKAYVGQDWARGQLGTLIGIFPLNFVEVIEDLPPPPSQQHLQPNKASEAAKPAQAGAEWVVALYDFAGNSEGDLSFQQGDRIQISRHMDGGWSCGRLDGREGIFPTAFVESAGPQPPEDRTEATAALRGRALYDFSSDSDEELSLQVGDIITNLESIDEEWFVGDLRGKRALVPKNYIQVL
ncbi:SH3 domain-containing protein 19 ADAM-binding protein, partial [Takifugu flavidus]